MLSQNDLTDGPNHEAIIQILQQQQQQQQHQQYPSAQQVAASNNLLLLDSSGNGSTGLQYQSNTSTAASGIYQSSGFMNSTASASGVDGVGYLPGVTSLAGMGAGGGMAGANGFARTIPAKDRQKLSLASLIGQAILSQEGKKARLGTIYAWITENYPDHYRLQNPGWQNSIRHNLTINKAFMKLPRETNEATGKGKGLGSYWIIHPDHEHEFQDGVFTGKIRSSEYRKSAKSRSKKSLSTNDLQGAGSQGFMSGGEGQDDYYGGGDRLVYTYIPEKSKSLPSMYKQQDGDDGSNLGYIGHDIDKKNMIMFSGPAPSGGQMGSGSGLQSGMAQYASYPMYSMPYGVPGSQAAGQPIPLFYGGSNSSAPYQQYMLPQEYLSGSVPNEQMQGYPQMKYSFPPGFPGEYLGGVASQEHTNDPNCTCALCVSVPFVSPSPNAELLQGISSLATGQSKMNTHELLQQGSHSSFYSGIYPSNAQDVNNQGVYASVLPPVQIANEEMYYSQKQDLESFQQQHQKQPQPSQLLNKKE